ncbi:MAG TPA: hypothetical protein VGK96_28480 [Candidatus Sulfotelmatobacter sp.]|jgi:hypothetical protein
MNGFERLWYCENEDGRVFLTSPQSPVPAGYQRFETTSPSVMDGIFKKLNAQTRAEHGQMLYSDYLRRRDRIEQWRRDIQARMASSDCSNAERELLQVALKACDNREAKLNRNSVYGVSAMQESAAPLPPSTTKTFNAEDLLVKAPTETEVIQ